MPSRRSIRRTVIGIAIALAVVIFVPPLIRLNRFRATIVERISSVLARQVTIRSVRLRLFPQPGFELGDFVVQDDPAFSAEPLLRADEVIASLRLSSLWRGHLEIGSLTLKSPSGGSPWSLNLVRAPDGRWALTSLLTRAAQMPAAPTAKARPEARPRFPYIEGEGGRINFKSGVEKKVYALSDADFALWLASENEWNMRLQARPVRTDSNLSDTGTIEISGGFGRAPRLEDTPLRLRVWLRGAQLGQLTRFVYGRDRGWRGSLNIAADLTGTAGDLKLSATAAVDDFRRYDIIMPDGLRLEARCSARYQWQTQDLSNLDCRTPNSQVVMRGEVTRLPQAPQYDLAFVAKDLPMAEVARIARHAKFALPADLTATGLMAAEFTYRTVPSRGKAEWAGTGHTSDLMLRSGVLGEGLQLGEIGFLIGPNQQRMAAKRGTSADNGEQRLAITPFTLSLGGASPAWVGGSLSRTDYNIDVHGEAELQRLFNIARALGLRAPGATVKGDSNVELRIAGNWSGFAAPVATGTLQLRNVSIALKGVGSPAHVRTATAVLQPSAVEIQNVAVSFFGAHVAFDGSLVLPRTCATGQACPIHFDLHSSELSADDLNRLLNPRLQKVPWYRLLGGDSIPSIAQLQAQGRLRVDRLLLKTLSLDRLTTDAELQRGKLRLSDVRADVLGGKIRSTWTADFTIPDPAYSGSGTLQTVSLAQVSALMHDGWATGTANAIFKLELQGSDAAALAQSAQGSLDFEWQGGNLQHVLLKGNGGPLRVKHFTGHAILHGGRLEFSQSKMEAPDGIYQVSGTATLGRLELKLVGRGSSVYAVSGSVEKPRVAALSDTQPALGK